ncbi:MAG: hypothetical protein ABEL04_01495, partial [Salinibacter sp.]|uniref:hypothetical protein n=1 Tax=Salinibacter sp. TaxID=2065818 RepID=UPI0035D5148C
GNRIYLRVPLASGDTLRFFTDTGGGPQPILTVRAARRLGLPVDSADPKRFGRTAVPTLHPRTLVPAPAPDTALVSFNRQINQYLGGDGLLGGRWHDGHVWTFDYLEEELLLRDSPKEVSFDPDHTTELAFATDSTGRRVGHHPMVRAQVADSSYSFLFDTGATTVLTDSARAVLGGPRRRGTGFISASVFDRWRQAHPEWTVMKNASTLGEGYPMIKVPEVTIAGHTVGPVWFERRPARRFRQMARRTGQPVRGALGGSLFRHFRITVDYPGGQAHFEKSAR